MTRVAIVGGGPAGAVASLVLATRGVAVTVLEADDGPRTKVGECLPPNATPLLARLGIDLEMGDHLRSYGNRFVWGSTRVEERPFLTGTRGDGWHVDRRRFEALLAARAIGAGVDWRWGRRLVGCAREGDRWRLEVATADGGGETVEADFVADASGRRAALARRLGARRRRYDRLVGVAALCAREESVAGDGPGVDGDTLVEAVEDGWWYSALLAGGRLVLVYFGDGDLLDRELLGPAPSAARLRERLDAADATRARVEASRCRVAGPLRVLPAESSRLDRIAGDGWLALGDAAAGYDPLSSHGIGSAMGSGYYAGCAVADLLAGRDDARVAYLDLMQRAYGQYLDLQRAAYARERRFPESTFWRRRQRAGYCLEPLEC